MKRASKATNNTFINADGSGGNFAETVSGNEYYASTVPSWDTNPAADTPNEEDAGFDTFCFTIMKITNPTTQCLEYAKPASVPNPTP